MAIITDIFAAISEIVSAAAGVMTDLFQSVVGIFFTTGDNGGLTVIGVLALVGVGFALVMWGFNFVMKLLKFR